MPILDFLEEPVSNLINNPQWDVFGTANENGAHGGFGFNSPDGNSQGLFGEGGIGTWTDRQGGVNRGVSVGGGIFKTGQQDSGYTMFGENVAYDVGVGTAQAGIFDRTSVRDDGLVQRTESAGAQANGIEASATVGDDDGSLRLGMSAGSGLAARRHMVDIDGDGEMELNGFGMDIGNYSFDVKSDLLADLLKDAPELAFDDLDEIGDIPDILANPGDYMPDLDDYEMPSLDHLPDLDNYELPDFGDLPDFSMPDFFGGGDSAEEAPMPPTGLLDETTIDLINNGIDPEGVVY